MPIFCAKCGVKNNSEDKFCKDCGTKLAGSAESPKEEVKSEQPSAPESTPVTPTKPDTKIDVAGIIRIIVGGILSMVALWAFMQFIFSLNSDSNITPGGNTNGGGNPLCSVSCPAYAPWYCAGQYYDSDNIQRSLRGCLPTTAAQAGYSSWSGRCTKCP